MALRVFNLGETSVSTLTNRNTATTPVATCESGLSDATIIAAVYPDDTTLESIYRVTDYVSATAQTAADELWLGHEFSNLEKTEGNIIKVYDSLLDKGAHLPPSVVPVDSKGIPTTNYYFVMIHSDNPLKHHFARIIEIVNSDVEGDTIKFDPPLGNEIPFGVKFQLFKGPALTSDFLAIGLGIHSSLQNNLNISRPYFWFKDKKNELDNNTKCFLRVNDFTTGTNITFANISGSIKTTFLVGSNFQDSIKDYSRYSLITTLTDNLKNMDIVDNLQFNCSVDSNIYPDELRDINNLPSHISVNELLHRGLGASVLPEGTYVTEILTANSVRLSQNYLGVGTRTITLIHSNETHLLNPTFGANQEAIDLTDYEKAFFHARRDGDDLVLPVTNYTSRGPKRYLHYEYSNDKVNYSYNVIDMNLEESISGRTSFCEVKLVDMMKIYPTKLENNDLLRVRQRLDKSSLHAWVETQLKIGNFGLGSTLGVQQFQVNITEASDYFSVGEEIKIKDNIFIIQSFSNNDTINLLQRDTAVDGLVKTYSRLDTESLYVDIGEPILTAQDKIYRRAYSPFTKTLIIPFELINNRFDDIYLVTTSQNSTYNYFKCTLNNYNRNMLTFEVELDKYLEEGLHFNGDYYIYYEKLNGNLESIDYYRNEGQSIMKVQGRDIMAKVLSTIVNTNTLFSDDFIYSSNSPLNELVDTGVYVYPQFSSSQPLIRTVSNGQSSLAQVAGDKFYVQANGSGYVKYLGDTAFTHTETFIQLSGKPTVEAVNDTYANGGIFKLFRARRNSKNIAFNKALSSNILIDSVTSLSGTSNKGLYFTGGSSLNASGEEDILLANTSSNDDRKSKGYHISKVTGEIDGADYQCVLGDGQDTETHSNLIMPNTLMDYSILSSKEKDDRIVLVIAPYIPITLGRAESNLANDYHTTSFTKTNTVITSGTGTLVNYVKLVGHDTANDFLNWGTRGSSLLLDGKFVGIIMDSYVIPSYQYSVIPQYTAPLMVIILDREISYTDSQTVSHVSSLSSNQFTASDSNRSDGKETHELKFINSAHLHGGKLISHIHSHHSSANGLSSLDFVTKYDDNSITTCFQRFGDSLYSIYSLEKGDEINYAASYKINGKNNSTIKSRRNYVTNHLSIESRGVLPPTYSNFDEGYIGVMPQTFTGPKNYDIIETGNSSNDDTYRSYLEEFNTAKMNNLRIRQFSVDRMFLFVNSDESPYHQDRKDSLANSAFTRDISKYNIIGILPTNGGNSFDEKDTDINTIRHTNIDSDYSISSIISSNKTINSLMNVGIMRLTEVVVDWAFNQIDPEKPLVKSDGLQIKQMKLLETIALGIPLYLQTGSYNPTVGSSAFQRTKVNIYNAASGGSIINLTAGGGLLEGDMLVTHGQYKQRVIGMYIGGGGNDSTLLAFPPLYANSDGTGFYTGEVRFIRQTEYGSTTNLKGHGDNDTFIELNKEINMYKTAYFNSLAHTSNQKYVTIDNVDTPVISPLIVHAHSATDGTPAPSENWFAHQFYDENGNRIGYFFWFNVETPSYGNVDTIPDIFATDFTGETNGTPHHPSGINYTSVEIQLVDGYTDTEFHTAIAGAYDSVNLRTNHVYGSQFASDIFNVTNYGGPTVTQWRTKRGAVEDAYLVETSATPNHEITFTIAKVNENITADGVGSGDTGSAYHTRNANTLGGAINNYNSSIQRKAGTYLPIITDSDISGTPTSQFSVFSKLLNASKSDSYADIATTNSNEMLYENFVPIALGSFKIEDSKKDKKVIQIGETFPPIHSMFRRVNVNNAVTNTLFGLSSEHSDRFNRYKYYSDGGSTIEETTDKHLEANGLDIGFKPRLKLHPDYISLKGTLYDSSAQTVKCWSIDISGEMGWLKHLDLTGCYLAKTTTDNMDNTNDLSQTDGFAFVLSHEIDHTNSNKMVLVTDSDIHMYSEYKILQPNHTTFYEFSPRTIEIGVLDSKYTKMPTTNECYSSLKSHAANDSSMDDNDSKKDMEGVGSAYVLVDLSGKVSSTKAVVNIAMQDSFVNSLPNSVCLSDGDTTFISGLTTNGHKLTFQKLKTLKGVTSISELMSVEVSKDFNTDSKRCNIGNTVSIVEESEEMALTLLENQNLEVVVNNKPNYPVFTSPDFKGTDLLTAVRYLLGKKNRDISIVDGKYVIDNKDTNDKYANVILSESGKYNIYEYEKEKTSFNVYNEIIVYGSTHKSVKKDIRSIKKIGRKTLEIFDSKLTTQEDVDLEARANLRLHSDLNYSYKVTVSSNGLEQIKSGDIIQLEIPRENIQRDEFIILSISHKLSNLMELELGKYSKSLGDRLVEIIREGNATKSYIRQNNFSLQDGLEMIDTIKIRDIRALVRKRIASGSPLTLGFAHTLNTSTLQLGFEGGTSITFENVWEGSL